jgi:hypothetical protein
VLSAVMRVKETGKCGRIYKKRVTIYRSFFFLYWEKLAAQFTEERKKYLKSSHKFQGKRLILTNLLWLEIMFIVCILEKQLFFCALFVSASTAE